MPDTQEPEAPVAPDETATTEVQDGSTPQETTPTPEAPAASDESANEPSTAEILAALDRAAELKRTGIEDDPESPETDETAPPEKAAEPVPPVPPAPDADDDDGPEGSHPRNFRFSKVENPKLANYLKALKAAQRENPNVNPADVAATVGYAIPAAPAPKAPEPAPQDTPPPEPPALANLRQEIEKLDKEIEEAEAVYDFTKARKLDREVNRKQRELEKTEDQLKAQEAISRQYHQNMQAANQELVKLCPEANDENSLQFRLIDSELNKMEQQDPSYNSDPRFAIRAYERAKALFPQVFTPPAKPAAPAKPATPPKPAAAFRPVGVTVPAGKPTPPVDVNSAIREMSTADVLEAMNRAQLKNAR